VNQWVAFFLLALSALILVLLIRRFLITVQFEQSQPGEMSNGDLDLSRLIAQLGDPKHRDQSRNRLLALGPKIVPELISQLVFHRFHIESMTPKLISEIETLVIDFGPSAVQPILDRLSQWAPTHRCAPSLIRMCRHLGLETIQTVIEAKRSHAKAFENLKLFLPHLLIRRPDIRTCPLFVTGPQGLPATALLVSLQPREWATLWIRLCPNGQHALLDWLKAWCTCIDASFLEFLLLQAEDEHLARVFELTTLKPDPRLRNLIENYTSHSSDQVRIAAVRTLGFFRVPLGAQPIRFNMEDSTSRVAAAHLTKGIVSGEIEPDDPRLEELARHCLNEDNIDDTPLSDLIFSRLSNAHLDIEISIRIALSLVYPVLEPSKPLAFERLLSLCSTSTDSQRVVATLSLALHNDQRALEGYRRCIQQSLPAELNIYMQQAAVRIGAPLARMITSRLVAKGSGSPTLDRTCLINQNGHLLLSQLRCINFESATDIVLELIEADMKDPMTGDLALTLQSGGVPIRQYNATALKQPERGLILPAVRYLGLCPDLDLLDELLNLFTDFDVVRNQVLTLVEYLDDEGLRAIERAIERGGTDGELDVLLETQSWLLHCVHQDSA
jgi:hypothetical protein